MIDPTVFIGEPLEFGTVCKVYPPKVKDVITNPKVLQLFKMLTYSQEDIEDLFTELEQKTKIPKDPTKRDPTPFEFLLVNCFQSKDFQTLVEEGFKVFTHETITFLYSSKIILFGTAEDLSSITDIKQFRYLSEDNFFDFQNVLRMAMGVELVQRPEKNEEENPIVKRVKAAGRRRKRLASKSKKGMSLTTTLGAICCMGIGLTPLNIGEISYASIDVIMTLYQQKEKYQTDIDSLMAGADPKKIHPKYWIRENSDFNEIKI